ncbi:MAG: glycosyltransferase family 2 protein [Desulfarculales bacterium]|jgi:glycosyltransferase involved in cell wall biosynthesis|nr:glycosyltransferase family 2 protein [Desulfarculales bacterium]
MDKAKLISLIIPFYNEGAAINILYERLSAALAAIPDCLFEIICVDDGSRDNTLAVLNNIAEKDPRLLIIEFSRNFGKEAAMSAGLDYAGGQAVIILDADLQDPPELIAPMLELWQGGAEVVNARRTNRQAESFLKRRSAGLFYWVHNKVSYPPIPANVGDFRLLDRKAVNALKQMPERQRFMKGLFSWVGFKSAEIAYRRETRSAGKSKFSGFKLWNFALEGITSFSTLPLRVWTYIGVAVALPALGWGAFTLVKTLVFGIDVPGYASTIIAVLFLGGLQLISVGVLGEYIGRIYAESKNRPLYIIRRIHGRQTRQPDRTNGCSP